MELTTMVVDDVAVVPRADWDRVAAPAGLYLSHGWLRAVQDEPGFTPHYVLAHRRGELVGALPVFDVRTEGNDFYAPARHQESLSGGGHWLVAGARRGYRNGIPVDDADLTPLLDAARQVAADRGAQGLVWRFVPTAAARALHARGASVAFEAVDASITATGWAGYVAGLTARRRSATLRERRRFTAAEGYLVREVPLRDCWKDLAALVANVQQKYGHGTTAEQMGRVLERQLDFLDGQSVVFTIERDGELVAGALEYRFGDTLYGRMVGFDYPRLAGAYEYFNLVYYLPVEYLERHGLRRLHLGIEAEDVKVERGAQLSPLWTLAMPVDGSARTASDRARAAEREWRARYDARVLPAAEWDVPW